MQKRTLPEAHSRILAGHILIVLLNERSDNRFTEFGKIQDCGLGTYFKLLIDHLSKQFK